MLHAIQTTIYQCTEPSSSSLVFVSNRSRYRSDLFSLSQQQWLESERVKIIILNHAIKNELSRTTIFYFDSYLEYANLCFKCVN